MVVLAAGGGGELDDLGELEGVPGLALLGEGVFENAVLLTQEVNHDGDLTIRVVAKRPLGVGHEGGGNGGHWKGVPYCVG